MIHLMSGVQLKWILTAKELTFCLLTVKQDATLPSTAWKGLPLLFAWDEWTDCQPTRNLPKHYWIIGKAKLRNLLRRMVSKICLVIFYGSNTNLIIIIKKKPWNDFTITKDLRSSVSQMSLRRYRQDLWTSFHFLDRFSSKPHCPLFETSGYPECQMLAETLLPSNQSHVRNLRIPRNALMLSRGYLLAMMVRWSPMIFLSISESTTAKSPPCRKQDLRASPQFLATEVPANTRKHESATSNQPESHVDPMKSITNVIVYTQWAFCQSHPISNSMILADRKRYFTDYISSWIFINVNATVETHLSVTHILLFKNISKIAKIFSSLFLIFLSLR